MKLVKRGAFALLLLSFAATARCYNADIPSAVASVPFVGAMIIPHDAPPAYVEAIGTPAPVEDLPASEVGTWWPEEPDDARSTFSGMRTWLVAANTTSGWAVLCGAATREVGGDREKAEVQLAGLACSADPSVTRLQQFAALVLRLDPETQLFLSGAPGSSRADIESTLAQIRVECSVGYASRALPVPAVAAACALPDSSNALAQGDTVAFLQEVVDAYHALAEEVVAQSPETAPEPAFFLDEAD